MVNLWIPCWKHCTSKLRRQSTLFYTWTRKPLRLHSSPLEFRQRQWSNAFQSKAAGELETSKGFLILWTLSISSFLTTFSEHGGCLQVQDLALSVKLHEILDCPPLEHVQVPLDGSRALWWISHYSHCTQDWVRGRWKAAGQGWAENI